MQPERTKHNNLLTILKFAYIIQLDASIILDKLRRFKRLEVMSEELAGNGCMWAANGGHTAPLKSLSHKQGDKMVMTELTVDVLADWTTPLEADTGKLVVMHGRLPHLLYENNIAAS